MTARKPRQRDVYRALLAPGTETRAVVVSCDEANAVRGVVVLCELREDPEKRFRGLPTTVELRPESSGLDKEYMAIASPYTVPQSCLIEKEGSLPPWIYEEVEDSLKRVLGWQAWPPRQH